MSGDTGELKLEKNLSLNTYDNIKYSESLMQTNDESSYADKIQKSKSDQIDLPKVPLDLKVEASWESLNKTKEGANHLLREKENKRADELNKTNSESDHQPKASESVVDRLRKFLKF